MLERECVGVGGATLRWFDCLIQQLNNVIKDSSLSHLFSCLSWCISFTFGLITSCVAQRWLLQSQYHIII